MLRELAIKNFAIIDDIRISFSSGLCVLTGETGAGKSIIIEAVNLLLGGRASADLVRTGEENAELEACFEITPDSPSALIMKSLDLNPEEGLIIRRIISAGGRHRIFINATQATIQLLKQVTDNLASISSQHAHQGLLKEDNHLDILDRFAGTWEIRNQVSQMYNELLPLIKKIVTFKKNISKVSEENELLKFQIEDIEKAKILPDEDTELESARTRLKKSREIYETMHAAMDDIYTREGSVLERLGGIRAAFEKHGEVDNNLVPVAENFSRIMFELEDINNDLREMADRIDLRPEILEETETRLDYIQKLKRKYNVAALSDLFDYYESLKKKISGTEDMVGKIQSMEKRAGKLSRKLGTKALSLSSKRKIAAKKLSTLAEEELKELDMGNTLFKIELSQTSIPVRVPAGNESDDGTREKASEKDLTHQSVQAQKFQSEKNIKPSGKKDQKNKTDIGIQTDSDGETSDFSSNLLTINSLKIFASGIDKVSFLMAPNPGEAPRPLVRIASGGELSRVVLALKAILSETESLDTLVFDEVDAGIGGRTADKVGKKISRLAETYQVICITHLAQIAKYATSHFKIQKKVKNKRTATSITPLKSREEKVEEIARMMGGAEITEATLAHAAEMVQ